MPNHVTHKCVVMGINADIEAFRAAHFHDGEFCFETIVSRPAIITKTESSTGSELWFFALTGCFPTESVFGGSKKSLRNFGCVPGEINTAAELEAWLTKTMPNDRAKGEASVQALRETGYPTWYEWCRAKWGTKWGAYDVEIGEASDCRFVFKFETAWSFPMPIFKELARRWPGLIFDLASFDEGWNFACEGQFNGRNDFREVKATDEMYERVYGRKPEREED